MVTKFVSIFVTHQNFQMLIEKLTKYNNNKKVCGFAY